jgi:hypothetical protein
MSVVYTLLSDHNSSSKECGQQQAHPQQLEEEAQEEARKAASLRAQEVVGLGGVEDKDLATSKHKPKLQQPSIVPAVALTILCVAILVLLVVAVFVWHPNVFKSRALGSKNDSDKALPEGNNADSKTHTLDSKPTTIKSKAKTLDSKAKRLGSKPTTIKSKANKA